MNWIKKLFIVLCSVFVVAFIYNPLIAYVIVVEVSETPHRIKQFIKEVYDNYLRGEKDEYGDIAIRRNQPIELSKID